MSPEDPRHGQNKGYIAGCRNECCRTAHANQRRKQRTRMYLARTDSLKVDGTGTRRRIQALMALGWSTRHLDAQLDRAASYTYRVLTGTGPVYLTTAQRFADLYDRMCMTTPTADNADQAGRIHRNQQSAARNGYAPPLSWDNIDDPDEHPHGVYKQPSSAQEWVAEQTARRHADLAHALEHDHTLPRVLADLGVERDSLRTWCRRNGASDVWDALKHRQDERDGRTNDAA